MYTVHVTVVYLTVTMALTSMSIILTVAVLQLHHVNAHQKPPSRLVRFAVLVLLARSVYFASLLNATKYLKYKKPSGFVIWKVQLCM